MFVNAMGLVRLRNEELICIEFWYVRESFAQKRNFMHSRSGIRTGSGSDRVALHSVMVTFHCVYFSTVDPVATAPGSDIDRDLFSAKPFVNQFY